MHELIERTSCAGCDCQVTGKKLDSLFATYEGIAGFTTDKSVQLLFPTKWQRAGFEKAAAALGVIFD